MRPHRSGDVRRRRLAVRRHRGLDPISAAWTFLVVQPTQALLLAAVPSKHAARGAALPSASCGTRVELRRSSARQGTKLTPISRVRNASRRYLGDVTFRIRSAGRLTARGVPGSEGWVRQHHPPRTASGLLIKALAEFFLFGDMANAILPQIL